MNAPEDETVDHEARKAAALAHQRIKDHEKHCAERFQSLQDAIGSAFKRSWWFAGLVIAGEGVVIALLAKMLWGAE